MLKKDDVVKLLEQLGRILDEASAIEFWLNARYSAPFAEQQALRYVFKSLCEVPLLQNIL